MNATLCVTALVASVLAQSLEHILRRPYFPDYLPPHKLRRSSLPSLRHRLNRSYRSIFIFMFSMVRHVCKVGLVLVYKVRYIDGILVVNLSRVRRVLTHHALAISLPKNRVAGG